MILQCALLKRLILFFLQIEKTATETHTEVSGHDTTDAISNPSVPQSRAVSPIAALKAQVTPSGPLNGGDTLAMPHVPTGTAQDVQLSEELASVSPLHIYASRRGSVTSQYTGYNEPDSQEDKDKDLDDIFPRQDEPEENFESTYVSQSHQEELDSVFRTDVPVMCPESHNPIQLSRPESVGSHHAEFSDSRTHAGQVIDALLHYRPAVNAADTAVPSPQSVSSQFTHQSRPPSVGSQHSSYHDKPAISLPPYLHSSAYSMPPDIVFSQVMGSTGSISHRTSRAGSVTHGESNMGNMTQGTDNMALNVSNITHGTSNITHDTGSISLSASNMVLTASNMVLSASSNNMALNAHSLSSHSITHCSGGMTLGSNTIAHVTSDISHAASNLLRDASNIAHGANNLAPCASSVTHPDIPVMPITPVYNTPVSSSTSVQEAMEFVHSHVIVPSSIDNHLLDATSSYGSTLQQQHAESCFSGQYGTTPHYTNTSLNQECVTIQSIPRCVTPQNFTSTYNQPSSEVDRPVDEFVVDHIVTTDTLLLPPPASNNHVTTELHTPNKTFPNNESMVSGFSDILVYPPREDHTSNDGTCL